MAFWGSGPSAGSSYSGDIRNVKLQSFTSSRGSQVHHIRGKHLSIEDVHKTLTNNVRKLNESGQKMLESLTNVTPHDFQLTQQEFPVSSLQHVTDCESMERIHAQGGFRIINPTSRRGFGDLSFWSAGIGAKSIKDAREKSYEEIAENVPEAITYEERIKAQFANSPAFNTSASRYGNFRFSFPLLYLLDQYQAQHCGGAEPQLRILGTDMYKQEITHYILVHSPDNTDRFRDLPMVPTDSDGHPFAYIKDKTIYWTPESTSIFLKFRIGKGYSNTMCNYKKPSLWNHLVIVFHLPNRGVLKVPKKKLLNSLKACNIGNPTLLDDAEQLKQKEAQKIVRDMKNKSKEKESPGSSKRKGSPQVQNGAKKMKESAETSCTSVSDRPSKDLSDSEEDYLY